MQFLRSKSAPKTKAEAKEAAATKESRGRCRPGRVLVQVWDQRSGLCSVPPRQVIKSPIFYFLFLLILLNLNFALMMWLPFGYRHKAYKDRKFDLCSRFMDLQTAASG